MNKYIKRVQENAVAAFLRKMLAEHDFSPVKVAKAIEADIHLVYRLMRKHKIKVNMAKEIVDAGDRTQSK